MSETLKVQKSDDEWRALLSPELYRIAREHGTEPAWSHLYNTEKRDGMYYCAACNAPLFSSDTKYESGSGWPSFFKPLDGAVDQSIDRSHGMVRVEAHCASCGAHLGHIFPDGPNPTGQRFCMNGTSLAFKPEA
ncbi:MAG: peptide-methionine (R)-S-oxide reductase MsrB [Devosia sp.]|uniref:peptide-methionine (R)-S-oxide reductase MsrB n=1 Tax=Devosia sp. TaxID=1871048 RepID=UPI001AC6F75D|nr:peptide-methionine (R)-S-oxide reductase MsrB [Devosia sp.]MBN9310520.1 peptide-methionine (R)-S-oxide reductase MsrB [Devosia sp.]MBN9317357.1 peptide-methionine (R)-S-oxide reductase MsrB [Devosia sp.]